jgi:D-hexose-6-phosphate mutarotase
VCPPGRRQTSGVIDSADDGQQHYVAVTPTYQRDLEEGLK